MLTTEQFDIVLELAVYAQRENPEWRWGQAVFNTLRALHKAEAEAIRATEYDMFHDEGNIEKYKQLLKDNETLMSDSIEEAFKDEEEPRREDYYDIDDSYNE